MKLRCFLPQDMAAVALGADEVAVALLTEAARRGLEVILTRTGTRGLFWLEPLLEVATPDGRIGYGPVSPGDIPGLLDAIVEDRGHPLSLGMVEAIPFLKRQTRLTFARAGIIDPLSIDDYRTHGGLRGVEQALALGPARIVETVTASGLRGRGGAGFPTGLKWHTTSEAPGAQKYIVCNADEGDSGTYADRMVMEGDPFMLIEG
ncbi:MAG: formate dehydrogenase, partial [Acetobacteraceae bacterium]|nr:formate dehydrogenase [Acetobacteraceae bacterium]